MLVLVSLKIIEQIKKVLPDFYNKMIVTSMIFLLNAIDNDEERYKIMCTRIRNFLNRFRHELRIKRRHLREKDPFSRPEKNFFKQKGFLQP